MIKKLLQLVILLSLSNCSSAPEYIWKGSGKAYLDKYKQMMLKGDNFQASYYLKDAKKEASNDFSLKTQAIIALTECAMKFALLQEDNCSQYQKIASFVKDEKLESFYKLLHLEQITQVEQLGKYTKVYQAINEKNISLELLNEFETIESLSIASMLMYKHKQMRKDLAVEMVDRASKVGAYGLMKVWIEILKEFSTNDELKELQEKIKLLTAV